MKFSDFQRDHQRRLVSGLQWTRFEADLYSKPITRVLAQMKGRTGALALEANSYSGRIRWHRAFRKHLGGALGAEAPSYVIREPAFLLTFIDAALSVDDAKAAISTRTLRHRYGSPLKWVNCVGMLEPALYVSMPRKRFSTGSLYLWHFHGVVWGCSAEELRAMCRAICKQGHDTLIPRAPAVEFRPIVPWEFHDVVGYINKSPRHQYSLSPLGTGTSIKQYKRMASGANLARLHRHLDGLYLDELAIAQGEGKDVLKAIKADALRDFRVARREGRI